MRFVQEFGSVWAYPDFVDRSTGDMPSPSDFQAMTNPTQTRRQFTALQRQDAVELCLAEGLTCRAVAQRLGLPNSTLVKWVRQARIDRGDLGATVQGQLTSNERAELNRLRKENRELKREKDFFKLAAAHFAREQLPPKGFA